MEIERKFLVDHIPYDLNGFHCRQIEQAYLNTEPVVRIRRDNDAYYLTYKSKGFLVREEYNLPLDKESYLHLRPKADGIIITKKRYEIPYGDKYTIELDIFEGRHAGLVLAEVEFASTDEAENFPVPDWFSTDVTSLREYSNSNLSKC
ncbi:MAG: CYTH domain-containing protein [Alistipes sp.]|nr:CYTH domain-containing protein [Alistipes sp.]